MSDRLPAPGQRVHLAAGGGHYFNGSCMCHITNQWGTHALVMLDCGEVHTCYSMSLGPSIGWHPGAVNYAHDADFKPSMLGQED